MMEITILKTVHAGAAEARKLVPYIQACELFGPEASAMTEQAALLEERSWRENLERPISRSRLKANIEQSYNAMMFEVPPPRRPAIRLKKEYHLGLYDGLLCNNVPILFAERWTVQQSKGLQHTFGRISTELHAGLHLLHTTRSDDGVAAVYSACKKSAELTSEQDRHIAGHLNTIDTLCATHYPKIDTTTARYTVQIGHMHRPEKYLSGKVRVVPLVDENDRMSVLLRDIEFAIADGTACADVAPLIHQIYR